MKFLGVFRFELGYQLRRVSTWLYFPALAFFAFVQIPGQVPAARSGEYFVGAPFVVASATIFGCLAWLVVAAYFAGDAAARDGATRMDPLTYTAPVSKADYLGGRFLAAFVLNALILIGVPAGVLLGVHVPEVEAEIRGPFLPMAYLTAYAFIALPSAFVVTAVQFSFAVLSRRAVTSYLASLLFLAGTQAVGMARFLSRDLRQLLDPLGVLAILRDDLTVGWTQLELNTRLIAMEGGPLTNRLLWIGIAVGVLAFTHYRFRFHHPRASSWWSRITRRRDAYAPAPAHAGIMGITLVSIPQVRQTFGFATRVRQTIAIAWPSFRTIARSWSGLIFTAAIALLAFAMALDGFMRVPLLPRSEHVLAALITPQPGPLPWLLIPLFIVFWAGELIWREREAGLAEITDATPVPEWVLLLGKFLGLSLVPIVFMALLMTVGMLVQVIKGYPDLEVGLYLRVLFGLQLADYVQLALFALGVHVLVNQKHIGQVVVLVTLMGMMIAYANEMGHDLLVPVFNPGWSYTDMRGFGPSLGPWLWLKLYWVTWVLLLAVVARLLWVRGHDPGLGVRLRIARRRFTRPTAATAAAVVVLILTSGGFIFYNTNVLNDYSTASDRMEARAEYERRYGQYEGIPQPRLSGTSLHVEIYPARREVQIRGTYRLVNSSAVAIDSIHLATVSDVETVGVEFDRPATLALADEDLGHRIYALEELLEPGDSLGLSFEVDVALRDFSNRGVDASVSAHSTFFTSQAWLPAIGYQRNREIGSAGVRSLHGLEPRPAIPSPYDVEAHQLTPGAERIAFDAVVGTVEDQVAIAPGVLRRTWTEGGRRYFHYSTDAPIGNEYAFFSADYAVHEAQWSPSAGSGDVAIQIFHHPRHTANLDRMIRSVRASLDYNTEQFGPTGRNYIRLVERPGHGFGLHAESDTIFYGEGFSLLNPDADSRGFDMVFAIVAHEVGHGWGIPYAPVEGAGLLSESFAWYAAMGAVREGYGRDHLRRLLSWMRSPAAVPPVRATVPLLRSNNEYLSYRQGPFAFYALSEYVGEDRINGAFRRVREAHQSAAAPRATSLDLYRELQAVTPDSLQYLLYDLFEANTFWELETEQATAEQTESGAWQVTLDVQARKVVVDTEGVETEVPMDDWVQIGVFAPAEEGEELGAPIYVQMHRIRSTEQTITVTVPSKPAHAGGDPNHLLIDWEMDDNIEEVRIGS